MQGPGRAGARSAYHDHPGLQWLRSRDAGRVWLSGSADSSRTALQWRLTLGPPFAYAYTSLALAVVVFDQTQAC